MPQSTNSARAEKSSTSIPSTASKRSADSGSEEEPKRKKNLSLVSTKEKESSAKVCQDDTGSDTLQKKLKEEPSPTTQHEDFSSSSSSSCSTCSSSSTSSSSTSTNNAPMVAETKSNISALSKICEYTSDTSEKDEYEIIEVIETVQHPEPQQDYINILEDMEVSFDKEVENLTPTDQETKEVDDVVDHGLKLLENINPQSPTTDEYSNVIRRRTTPINMSVYTRKPLALKTNIDYYDKK